MAFFGNDAVNRVNLHYAIQALAQGAGGALVFAFLLHAGVSIPMTFVWLAGMIAGRFVLRPLILPIGKRWGLKPLVIAGVLVTAIQYPTNAAADPWPGPWRHRSRLVPANDPDRAPPPQPTLAVYWSATR